MKKEEKVILSENEKNYEIFISSRSTEPPWGDGEKDDKGKRARDP